MATIDLDAIAATSAAAFTLEVSVSASAWTGFFTGQRMRRSNLADRLRATLTLPPCRTKFAAAAREALLLGVLSGSDYVRLPMPHRSTRNGTMAGSPTVTSNTAAGSRTLPITTTAGATLAAGDWIGVGGNLLQAGYGGGTANGSGLMSLALVLPTQRAITAGAAVAYNAPTGVWEIDTDALQIDYSPGLIQGGIAIPLLQVIL